MSIPRVRGQVSSRQGKLRGQYLMGTTGAFHAAFDSGAGDAQPRESVEIRVVAFR